MLRVFQWIRRGAWWGLAGLSTIVVVFGIGDLTGGISADPAITLSMTGKTVDATRDGAPLVASLADLAVRVGGATMIALGLGWLALLVAGVRSGHRWTWVSMWTMPIWSILVTAVYLSVDRVPGTPLPPPLNSGPVFVLVSAALLLVTPGGLRVGASKATHAAAPENGIGLAR
jgi:hypothetical protein